MSRQAIAAALACADLAGGERLVAFAPASYAGRDGRGWPGALASAARAGLSRSRYLHDRDRLVRRGGQSFYGSVIIGGNRTRPAFTGRVVDDSDRERAITRIRNCWPASPDR